MTGGVSTVSEKLTEGKSHIRQGCDHKSISFDLDHSFEKSIKMRLFIGIFTHSGHLLKV